MRRKTAGQQDFGIYGFEGGLNIKAGPQELADNELTQGLNGYLRPDGAFQSRQGLRLYQTLPVDAPVQGLFRFVQLLKGDNPVTVIQTLAQCGTGLYDLDSKQLLGTFPTGSNPWSVTMASDPQADPYPNAAQPGQVTDVAVICVGGGHGPYIYDGNTLYHPPGWANAKGAQWCQLVNGILWFGGIQAHPTQVMAAGTGIGTDVSFEEIAGYAIFDLGLPVTGLSIVGAGAQAMLAIGLPAGLGLLYGTGPANYTLQMVPMDNDGVSCGYSMVSNNGTLYFLGDNNSYSFNPYTSPNPVPFSLKVQPWITDDPFVTGYPMQGRRSQYFGFMYYDRYHIAYCSDTTNQFYNVLVYDTNIQGWTVLQLGVSIASQTLVNAPFDPSPAACLVGGSNGRVYTWEAYVGQENTLWNAAAWNVGIWDDDTDNSDDGAVITVWIATKFFKVGEPGTVKCLHRIYPEILYPSSFGGTATVQTDYGLEAAFTSQLLAIQGGGALWDQALWDDAFWSATPPPLSSWNAPESRIDVNSQLPNNIGNFMVWNVSNWNAGPWGSVPLPPIIAPGIQGEAFSFGLQSGIGTQGAIWDESLWDNPASTWSASNQLPWILSGITGSFSQNGRR
jgi:hypothetical protein